MSIVIGYRTQNGVPKRLVLRIDSPFQGVAPELIIWFTIHPFFGQRLVIGTLGVMAASGARGGLSVVETVISDPEECGARCQKNF